jgi:hypothetical protein
MTGTTTVVFVAVPVTVVTSLTVAVAGRPLCAKKGV